MPLSSAQIKTLYQEGLRLAKGGDPFGALDRFETLAATHPTAPEIPFQLGRISLSLGRPRTAVTHLERARALAPAEDAILVTLAKAYAKAGQPEAAAEIHIARTKAHPKDLAPRMDHAWVLQQSGDFDAADKVFRAAYALGKTSPEYYRLCFAGSRIGDPKDKRLAMAQRLWAAPRLNAHQRLHLGFALAKAMEDLGRTDRVFAYLDAANRAQGTLASYDRAERAARLEEARRMVPDGAIARLGSAEAAPIFIIGLPRSGTTLIESILAAHPEVRAGGEIAQIRPMAHLTLGRPGHLPPIDTIPEPRLALFAERYALSADETARGPGARITDKSMQTQLILGLIAVAFPKAHFIVVRRDPRDVALSIYKNHFETGTHTYSNRLEDIAHQIRCFDAAIDIWRDHLPMTEIVYEDLVSDPEPQTRALVAAAGLDWNAACLDHRSGSGSIKTLSIAQVRQPIYTASQGGWRRYEAEMAPFLNAWEGSA